MRLAYVDTSCLVAIAFNEAGARGMASRLRRFDRRFSSNLLEAELRSALVREGVRDQAKGLLSWITWIFPNRTLIREFDRITAEGYLKGAGMWRLANALFLAPRGKGLAFLTPDKRQKAIAAKLGFAP